MSGPREQGRPAGNRTANSSNLRGLILPPGVDVDGSRPSVAWVTSLPAEWLTSTQRLVLLVLACDAFDNESRPGEDQLLRWCGIRSRSTLYDALGALAAPLEGVRPALIERSSQLRKRTTYRLLTSGTPDTSGQVDASGYVSGDASGTPDTPFPFPNSTHLPNSTTEGAPKRSGWRDLVKDEAVS